MLIQNCYPPFTDCDDDLIAPPSSSKYEPVFLNQADFEKMVTVSNSAAIGSTGKICNKDNLLSINELNKGFHINMTIVTPNPEDLKLASAINRSAFDVIISNDLLIAIGDSGLYQCRLANDSESVVSVTELSTLSI